MNDSVRRIDPSTDPASAAIMLGCQPQQIGPCARCQGLTVRYGSNAQLISPACCAKDQTPT
ncbi:hypothetical protein [Streptomyces cavernae]|uniref:hypothetical protein n=1 Tax=Streptomyces cavernae TaxID=2259034 RepID=UPI000FEB6CE5|nr:hypothetical protein [Streptomyces cavernae]